jgi:DNA-binding XRE family transcriptional regulator
MGVLEIIAEHHLGVATLLKHGGLRRSFAHLDALFSKKNAGAEVGERERVASIVELCFEYDRESDPEEKENILRTLEEISSNEPLELPAQTVEEWEEALRGSDNAFAKADKREHKKTEAFLKRYFSLRAKSGLATQADVASKSGLSRGYVAVIESGEHFPQQKTLQKLARAFGVDVAALL